MGEYTVLDNETALIVVGIIFAFALSIASFCWAVQLKMIKHKALLKRYAARATVNFNQEAFSSLAYFSNPFFHAYKDAAYSVASMSTGNKSQVPVEYSLFYFKRKLGMPGGLVNNRPEGVFSLRGEAEKFGINHYGSNQIRKIDPGMIKEIFGGRDVFVEISADGVVLGFRPVAACTADVESLYTQCNELMWKAVVQDRAA